MLRRLLNLALVILLAPLFYAFVYEGLTYLASVFTFDSTKWFLLGSALGIPVALLLLSSGMAFIRILLHELEHAALYLIFNLQWPSRLEVESGQGGAIYGTAGSRGGCLVTLAPYYFPMLAIPFLLLKALAALLFSLLQIPFPAFLAAGLDLFIGATLMLSYLTTLMEFRLHQPDIQTTGFIPSLVGVLFMSFMFLVLSLAVVTGTYAEFWAYIKAALLTTWDTYKAAWEYLWTTILPALQDLVQAAINLICPDCTPNPTN